MIKVYNFGGKNDRPCTHLPTLPTLDNPSLRNAHLVFNTKQKNMKIEYVHISI